MALMLGELAAVIGLDMSSFEKGLGKAEKKLAGTGKATEATADKMQAAVDAASKKVAAARKREEDAAGSVRVAEARLADARKKDDPTKVLVAAENLAKAQRNLVGAADAAKAAQEGLSEQEGKLKGSLDKSKGHLKDFGAKGVVIAAAAGAAIGAAVVKGVMDSMDLEKANDKLAASLGLTKGQSEAAGRVAGALYAGAYGDSMEDVTSAVGAVMSSIKGMRTASEADVQAVTANVMDLAAAFDIDVSRAAQVAGQMITSGLAKDGTEAADLLAGTLQKVPKNVREDLLDAVDEYAPFFKNLGYTGADAMGILANSAEKGMYGIDKTGDALKEFGIRATDMSKATSNAYDALGMDQESMTGKLLAGGDTAKQAFSDIVNGIGTMTDPVAQSQAALALFGTPLEDLSVTEIPKFLNAIDPMGDAFDSMKGKANDLGNTLADNDSTRIESFKRGLQTTFVQVLGGKVIPVIKDAAGWVQNNWNPAMEASGQWIKDNQAWLIPLTAAVAGYLAVMGGMSILTTVRGWVAAAAAAQWGLNAAMSANPIGLVVAGIAALVAGVIWAYHNIGWFKDGVDAAFKWIGEAAQNVGKWFTEAFQNVITWWNDTLLPAIGAVGKWFTDLFTNIGNWARDFVGFFVDGWGMLVDFWNGILLPAFQAVGTAIGAVFQGIYNFLKPVFDSIGTVFNGFYLAFRGVFQLVSSIITNIVVPLFKGFWDRMVEAFTGIGRTISDWWNGAVAVFNTVTKFIHDVLAAAFAWLYDHAIKPVFDAIGKAIRWVWDTVIKPTFDGWVRIFTVIIPNALKWLYDNAIKPVFDKIGAAAKWLFENLIKPTFDGWVRIFTVIIPDAAKWLYEKGIKPHFDAIGAAIKFVWEKVIKPVFDTLSNFVTKTIPKAFEDGVGFVKAAWNQLIEIAKTPVRFVIERVINDGLIGAFNTIAGVLPGIDKLPPVAVPGWLKAGAGFADGGYTGPGRKHDPAGIVHAGEVVWSQDDIRRHGGVGAVEGMRRGGGDIPKDAHPVGMPGAFGGESPYYSTPKIDLMRNLGRAFIRPLAGIDMAGAARAWNNVSRLQVGLGAGVPGISSAWGALPSNIYAWTQFGGEQADVTFNTQGAFSGTSPAMKRGVAIHELGHAMGLPHVTSRPSVMHPYMQSSLVPTAFDVSNMRRIYGMPGAGQTPATLGDPKEGGGWNPIADIVDSLVKKFKESFTAGGIMADIAIGIGRKIIDSASHWVENMITGKGNESGAGAMSPTVYDGGGWLENTGGPQLVQHNKSKPDAVLSHDQWETMRRIAENTGNGITYSPQIQYMGEDPETLLRRDKHRFVDLLDAIA